jgi:hypothetical protein
VTGISLLAVIVASTAIGIALAELVWRRWQR